VEIKQEVLELLKNATEQDHKMLIAVQKASRSGEESSGRTRVAAG